MYQNHMDQTDLVQKWSVTGLLRGVKPQYMHRAAERLERASRKSLGTGNFNDLDNKIRQMTREGIFEGSEAPQKKRSR